MIPVRASLRQGNGTTGNRTHGRVASPLQWNVRSRDHVSMVKWLWILLIGSFLVALAVGGWTVKALRPFPAAS